MESTDERRFLTVRELADFYRVSLKTAYQRVADGSVPSVRVGGQIRIPRAELDQQLADAIGKHAA